MVHAALANLFFSQAISQVRAFARKPGGCREGAKRIGDYSARTVMECRQDTPLLVEGYRLESSAEMR